MTGREIALQVFPKLHRAGRQIGIFAVNKVYSGFDAACFNLLADNARVGDQLCCGCRHKPYANPAADQFDGGFWRRHRCISGGQAGLLY